MKIAWGITGAGDKIEETVQIMQDINNRYHELVEIEVFISKAGDQVIKYYEISHEIENNFNNIWVEINANSPFLAGNIQLGDTLISNAAIMGQKADVPLYILPADYEEGTTITKLPDGKDLKLTIRKEDVEHVQKLAKMDNTYILPTPTHIISVFEEYFG